MKSFAYALTDKNNINGEDMNDMFTKWLTLITQTDIKDKEIVKKICEEAEIMSAVVDLVKLNEDKMKWLAYERRLDEIRTYDGMVIDLEDARSKLEETDRENQQLREKIKTLEEKKGQ